MDDSGMSSWDEDFIHTIYVYEYKSKELPAYKNTLQTLMKHLKHT
jgi:hypothetical protein